jgi:hypothetical protein
MACIIRNQPPTEFLKIQDKKFRKDWYGYREVFLQYLLLETNGYCPFSYAFVANVKYGDEHRERDDEEIEHFRPKGGDYSDMMYNSRLFSELCHDWCNLFPIISTLNKNKGSKWDTLLLKPDEKDYLEYMIYNPINGEIIAKNDLSENDLNKFIATKNIYKLNDSKLCQMRKSQYRKYIKNPGDPHPFKPLFENI